MLDFADDEQSKADRTASLSDMEMRVLTIGHSNHPFEHIVRLLKRNNVRVVVDTRSHPYSNHAPQFDMEPAKKALKASGLRYVYLGRELGGRPEGDEFYDDDGHVLYERVARSPLFAEGLRRLLRGIRKYRVALLCAEENPAGCHRRLLIGRVLLENGVLVEHIRGDGRIQSEAEVTRESGQLEDQFALFRSAEVAEWKSIPSVSRRKRQNSFSGF